MYSELAYRIADNTDLPPEISKPVAMLRRRGFVSVDGSVWYGRTDRIPWHFVQAVNGANRPGSRHWANVLAVADVRPIALYCALTTIEDGEASLRASLASAEAQLAERQAAISADATLSTPEREEALSRAVRYHASRVKTAQKAMAERIAFARQTVQEYTLDANAVPLESAAACLDSLTAGARSRAALYATLLESAPVAAAGLDSEAPAGLVADALEDAGEDTTALRAAFVGAEAPAAEAGIIDTMLKGGPAPLPPSPVAPAPQAPQGRSECDRNSCGGGANCGWDTCDCVCHLSPLPPAEAPGVPQAPPAPQPAPAVTLTARNAPVTAPDVAERVRANGAAAVAEPAPDRPPARGDVVRVVRGRKVPIGTVCRVTSYGTGDYGPYVHLESLDRSQGWRYVSPANLALVEPAEEEAPF